MATADRRLLLTCEHGGNRVPAAYRALFPARPTLLNSHRGYDRGALEVARSLARALDAPLLAATTTRLLVDLNRSPHHPRVFSEFTRSLPRDARNALLDRHHRPHRERVRAAVAARGPATLHVAVHSFTPALRGRLRSFAVGILYDPKRAEERELAIDWQRALAAELPGGIRRNAPYRGDADGLTTTLRAEYPPDRYLGIELELNQRTLANPRQRRRLLTALTTLLRRSKR